MKEKELCKLILKHCNREHTSGSFNIQVGNHLVSFNVKFKRKVCSKCGKEE